MAAATLMSPAAAYQHHAPMYSHHHPPPPPPGPPSSSSSSTMPNIASSSEPRRSSTEPDSAQRQSLPSLSEVFSGSKRGPFSPAPAPTPTSSGVALGRSLPPPPPPPPNSYGSLPPPPPMSGDSQLDRRSAPPHEDKPFDSQYRFPPRPEPGPPGPHGPPTSSFPYHEQGEPARTPSSLTSHGNDNVSHSNPHTHAHPLPPPPPPAAYSQQTSTLPPGQYPLTQPPPISPRNAGPPYSPHDMPRPPAHHEEDYSMIRRYDSARLTQHIEAWSYQDCLDKVHCGSRTIAGFAEGWRALAIEQHSGQTIPDRLPSEGEVAHMLSNVDLLKKSLENIRELVHQVHHEKSQENGKRKSQYDDEDVIYGDASKQHFGMNDSKKRRGRAAPPGRCHSCNRIDTPEWRRGPDGARTLCNACGLHYAKLERKRQQEARTPRPKAVE